MKRFVILTLCLCLVLCILAACDGEETELYVDGTVETTLATETESESEAQSEGESETKDPEQTMGAIQEMIPKAD
jgi:hypothetical protein